MTRVLLLLDQKENQQLLLNELQADYDVVVGSSDEDLGQEFDLCIVDGRSLDRLWQRVRERKEAEQPIFLPILLVTARPGVKMVTRQVWQSVDELIITPIEKPELRARIEILRRARTLSLELRQRAQDAEHATHTRDELMAIVSHDLRNPLNVVLTSSVFMLDTANNLTQRDRDQLEMIARAARSMNRLIQDLLEISGLEAGNVSIHARLEPAAALLNEACGLHRHAADAKGISIICSAPPDLPDVCADRDRVLQVLGNLIGNALKFTPSGGEVRVSAHADGEDVRVEVSDTGAGIPAEHVPRIFDRFWQASRSREGGAGLGLAIARSILQAHGSDLTVESEVGRGSTFIFTLPTADWRKRR